MYVVGARVAKYRFLLPFSFPVRVHLVHLQNGQSVDVLVFARKLSLCQLYSF